MDITDRKRMEYDLQQVQKLESLGVLAGGIAHDFNNCLASILGNLSFTRTLLPKESEGFEALTDAESSCVQARSLTQQLMTFSQGGKPVKKISPVAGLLEDSIRFALSGSNCNYKVAIAEDLWPAEIDVGQIHQVFNNLMLNAVQSMPAGGEIDVRADNITLTPSDISSLPKGSYLKIVIKDHGCGINPDDLPRIFDPYFSKKSMGHGLGLTTSHAIVSNHNGIITARSRPEGGSVFTVFLPAMEGASLSWADSDDSLIRGEGKILLMDDVVLVLKAVSKMCRSLGYEVETASDGNNAVKKYRTALDEGKPFDAVILDLTIPGGMGGKEVVRELIKINPDVRAIASSGYSNDPVMSDYSSYGFVAVIPKPYDLPGFSRIINSILKD
jgi:CheY-like chemotaxis protein